jgi:DNA-binding PadR family transcriptional regulator
MDDLTGFQRDLLYVIAGLNNPYGLEIKREVETYYETPINHGRLYPNLNTLADKGFLEKGEIDKRTNSYTLTEDAHDLLDQRRQWEQQYVSRKAES